MTKIKFNKRHENIVDVANWLMETSSVYFDYALQDAEELLERDPKEFLEILRQTDSEDNLVINWKDGTTSYTDIDGEIKIKQTDNE